MESPVEGGIFMAKSKTKKKQTMNQPRKPSKRERRYKFFIYLMIIIMIGSVITSGLVYIL